MNDERMCDVDNRKLLFTKTDVWKWKFSSTIMMTNMIHCHESHDSCFNVTSHQKV